MDDNEAQIRYQVESGLRMTVYNRCLSCKTFTVMEYFPQTRTLECPRCKSATSGVSKPTEKQMFILTPVVGRMIIHRNQLSNKDYLIGIILTLRTIIGEAYGINAIRAKELIKEILDRL